MVSSKDKHARPPQAPDTRQKLALLLQRAQKQTRHNLTEAALCEQALCRSEGRLSATGALCVTTGPHTGRAARDKFIVRDELTEETVWWEATPSLSRKQFDRLAKDVFAFAAQTPLFVQDLHAGAAPRHRLSVRVYTQLAWHALFIRHLLLIPEKQALCDFAPELTIISLPGFKADPERHGTRSQTVIACDFSQSLVLICGTAYAGEIKKAVFTTLNYHLPGRQVFPMHCSVNTAPDGSRGAVFFGLSGTGKTTLSADPQRVLVGDDEHGWAQDGLYNFEGGCYAKTIRLSPRQEPQIHAAVNRWPAILENVVLDPHSRRPDFDDAALSENSRGAYPLSHIENASPTGRAPHPAVVIFLTADAFGVLPPIARLTPDQAMYHFLSGYTAKVAGTEAGICDPRAVFSACFGAPFMPRPPVLYGEMLRQRLAAHKTECWLINTGWTGGPCKSGYRMPLAATRAMLEAVLAGRLHKTAMRRDPVFGFDVPLDIENVPSALLRPRDTWADSAAYDRKARQLAGMFRSNFAKFAPHVSPGIRKAGPLAPESA